MDAVGETIKAVGSDLGKYFDEIKDDPYKRGMLKGRATMFVASMFVGGGEAKVASKAGKGEEALKIASKVEKEAEVLKVASKSKNINVANECKKLSDAKKISTNVRKGDKAFSVVDDVVIEETSKTNKYCLNGEEHYESLRELFGSDNVEWVSKNKASFGSRNLLEGHFDKHGSEFGGIYNSADEYLQGAKDVMNNGYKVEYDYNVTDKWGIKVPEKRIGYIRFMGNNRKGEAKFEFVGTNKRGDITTYHTESGKTLWKLLNGSNTDKTINPIE